VFNDKRQLWLQQIAKGPINVVQPLNGYKVHGTRFHTRARSAYKKTYSCGVLVKGTTSGDSSGVDYYGVLEEDLELSILVSQLNNVYYSGVIGLIHRTLGVQDIPK